MDEENALKGKLHQFVAEWKRELVTTDPSRGLLGKRGAEGEDGEREEEASEVDPTERKLCRRREPSPLLVLPPGLVERTVSQPSLEKEERRKDRCSPSLLDTLIADLDDINTVPFFEVKLAREAALLIFRHLNMIDLCTCAQVSKSWRSLADDNVLWSGVCQRMGYDTAIQDGRQVAWKAVIKEVVLRKKEQLKNWKERVCGLSDIQPDRDGVLVCADFCPQQEQLLAGYSSGAVYVWTLTSEEEGPLVLESGHAQLTSSRPTLCCISRGWATVATEHGTVTVHDSCVGGEVHRVRGLGHVTSLDLRASHTSLIVGVASSITYLPPGEVQPIARSEVTVLVSRDGSDWQTLVVNPLQDGPSTTINQLAVLEGVPRLLYSTQTTLSLHPLPTSTPHPPPPPPSHLLTSAGSAGASVINCFDHTPSVVACATSAWGYHVQLYDLCTGGHMTTLRGHAQPVTSLNIHSSPPHTLVSGAADRRVRVFDTRRGSQPVVTLPGHQGAVVSTQCDEWKVASGGRDGLVVVWDRRMCGELWSCHERHPAACLWFTTRYLVATHLPERRDHRSLETSSEPLHRCQRGLLRVMDFSVDPLFYTRFLPSVCSSGYDEPSRSRYHLDLKLPYDTIS